MNEYNHLLLSALLHDIGKFYWRAGITGSLQTLFDPESIDKDLLLNLISKKYNAISQNCRRICKKRRNRSRISLNPNL